MAYDENGDWVDEEQQAPPEDMPAAPSPDAGGGNGGGDGSSAWDSGIDWGWNGGGWDSGPAAPAPVDQGKNETNGSTEAASNPSTWGGNPQATPAGQTTYNGNGWDLSSYEGRQAARDALPGWIVDAHSLYDPSTGSQRDATGRETRNTGSEDRLGNSAHHGEPTSAFWAPRDAQQRQTVQDASHWGGRDEARQARATGQWDVPAGSGYRAPGSALPSAPAPTGGSKWDNPADPTGVQGSPNAYREYNEQRPDGTWQQVRAMPDGTFRTQIIPPELYTERGIPAPPFGGGQLNPSPTLGWGPEAPAPIAAPPTGTAVPPAVAPPAVAPPATAPAAPAAPPAGSGAAPAGPLPAAPAPAGNTTTPPPAGGAVTASGAAAAAALAPLAEAARPGGKQTVVLVGPDGKPVPVEMTPENAKTVQDILDKMGESAEKARVEKTALDRDKFDLEKNIAAQQAAYQNALIEGKKSDQALQAAQQAAVADFQKQQLGLQERELAARQQQQSMQVSIERERLDQQRRQYRPVRGQQVRFK